jgi:hypothetical protein
MSALVEVRRVIIVNAVTLSKVYVNGVFECLGLEDPVRKSKVKGATAIQEGMYDLGCRYSPKFSPKYKHDLLWVKDVPEFEYILIHKGNNVDNTEGCLLLGTDIGVVSGKPAVLSSAVAYNKFYAKVLPEVLKGNAKINYINEY